MEAMISGGISIIMATMCALLAYSRGRSCIWWFFLGFLFNWIALLVLSFLSPVDQAQEEMTEEPDIEKKTAFDKAQQWFYLDHDKKVLGPYSSEGLKKLWKEGALFEKSWVWSKGTVEWKKICQVNALFDWLCHESEEERA